MTSFVNPPYSNEHPGVVRIESAIDATRQLGRGLSGTRGLATLLLSAIAAAVMVVAYQVMDSVAEGHLLVMWIALWGAAFATLALFAGTARRAAASLKDGLDGWSRAIAEARADQRLWLAAKSDPRLMAELQAAAQRSQADSNAASVLPAQTAESKTTEFAVLQRHQRYYL